MTESGNILQEGAEIDKDKTNVWVIKHSPTQWSKDHKVQGNVDTDILPDEAKPFLEKIGVATIPKPDIIAISALKRTQQTAEALRELMKWDDVQTVIDSGFNERKWGVMEGLFHEEARALLVSDKNMVQQYPYIQTPEGFEAIWNDYTFKPQDGESLEEVGARVKQAFLKLHDQYPGKNVLLISHAGVLQTHGLSFEKVSEVSIKKNKSGDTIVQKK